MTKSELLLKLSELKREYLEHQEVAYSDGAYERACARHDLIEEMEELVDELDSIS